MNTDEQFIVEHFGKKRYFRVPDNYFRIFHDRMMDAVVKNGGCPHSEKTTAHRIRLIACAAACVAVLLVCGVCFMKSAVESKNDGQVQSVRADVNDAENSFVEQVADYLMIDNDDLYAYIADE